MARKDPEWLKEYYARLQNEAQFSLTRRDTTNNWALTLFLAIVAAYAATLTSQISVSWKLALLLIALGLLVRFFAQSMIAYAFLRRWRYLENRIESHWANGEPSLEKIIIDIRTYDHGRRSTVTKRHMLWSQLRAGFLIIFIVLCGLVVREMLHLTQMSVLIYVLIAGFLVYLTWEVVIFVTYDQLKRPSSK